MLSNTSGIMDFIKSDKLKNCQSFHSKKVLQSGIESGPSGPMASIIVPNWQVVGMASFPQIRTV